MSPPGELSLDVGLHGAWASILSAQRGDRVRQASG